MPNQFNVSIWGDEGFSAVLSMKSIPEILKIIATDTSPPLWNLTEHLAFNAFGISEATIRGLAFIYFILTVFFVYKIGTLLWNRKTGLISAALSFLNPFFFIYAFEGRMYSILALGVTSSMYFFLRFFYKEGGQKLSFIGYIIASLWAMYSHHFAIFALCLKGFEIYIATLFIKSSGTISTLRVIVSAIAILTATAVSSNEVNSKEVVSKISEPS